ncbi:hypothetical protein [uncultured Fibrella sp.]|uniref:hypothetical protein n=1 Tax=uncultured Fibrella sp. TaxID=1284596 RepID=UPI0035C9C136
MESDEHTPNQEKSSAFSDFIFGIKSLVKKVIFFVKFFFDYLFKAVVYLPIILVCMTVLVFAVRLEEVDEIVVLFTRLNNKDLPKPQEMAINLTIELNKYIISIGAALFGLVGFYFNNYAQHFSIRSIKLAFLSSLLLLGLGGYYAFIIYSDLTNSLSQGLYPLNPGNSKVLAYIELEFILCLGASLSLGSIFVAAQFVTSFETT